MEKNNTPSLTDRMKGYEDAYRYYFTKRTPLVIRLDGKSFSNWTRSLDRPFDMRLSKWMQETVKYAMQEVQTCAFAYSNSDEISLFLRDWDKLNTDAWFGGNLQKIVSVTSSIVTAKFNDVVKTNMSNAKLAHFDARAYILPKDEVVNYFIYRQHEGIRNSVQMLAQSLFSAKDIRGINNATLKQMIIDQYPDQSWDNLDPVFRYGFALRKDEDEVTTNIPLFKDDRQYIEELVYIKGE